MTLIPKFAALSVLAVVISGCSSPRDYESTPVVVETPQGPVTCQLYTKDVVLWDRAIDRPSSMSVKTGDTYCLNEGQRRKAGGM